MMQAVAFCLEDGTPVLRCADGADASEVAEWAARVRRGGFGGVLEIRLAGPWTGDGREWEMERGRLAAAGVSVRAVALGDLSGMAAVAFVQASERVMAQGSSVRLGGGGAGFTDAVSEALRLCACGSLLALSPQATIPFHLPDKRRRS